jgi:hypothetical protein
MDNFNGDALQAPEGLRMPAFDQTPEQMALGRRAALELRLQDARRDLAEVLALKSSLLIQADVERALACEPGRRTVVHNSAAANLRLKAFLLAPDIHAARLRVANLESQLKGAPSPASAVVLTAEQTAAMDDMAGVL